MLARLLSVLEDPAGRRVVIAAAEPDEALLWIAAATLLLPARAALDVSFKVFCANPPRASQRIVAVPKELNPQFAPGRGDSAFVLDADEAASDASRSASGPVSGSGCWPALKTPTTSSTPWSLPRRSARG